MGQVVEPRDMLRSKLKTVGIGLIDRVPGPYELFIDRIWVSRVVFVLILAWEVLYGVLERTGG